MLTGFGCEAFSIDANEYEKCCRNKKDLKTSVLIVEHDRPAPLISKRFKNKNSSS